MPRSRTAILVVGMHRSGTSAFAGVVSKLGAAAPKTLMPGDETNPRGFWESNKIVPIHEAMLAKMESSWDDWLPVNTEWLKTSLSSGFESQLRQAIRGEFDESRLFVIKDPRICRFLPWWVQIVEELGIRPVVFNIVRNPLEVAYSLKARDGLLLEKSLLLWLRHSLDAERGSRGVSRCFLTYEQLLTDWRMAMARASGQTQIRWPRSAVHASSEIDDFLTPELHRHRSMPFQLEEHPNAIQWVKQVYARLQEMTSQPDLATALAALDEIRPVFEEACSTFGVMAVKERRLQDALQQEFATASRKFETERRESEQQTESLKRDIEECSVQLEQQRDLQRQLATAKQEHDALQRYAANLERERDGLRENLAHVECDRDGMQQHAVSIAGECDELRGRVAYLENDCTVMQERIAVLDKDRQDFQELANALTREYEALQRFHDDRERSFTELLQNVARLEKQREELKARVTSVQRDHDEVVQHAEKMHSEREEVAKQVALLLHERNDLKHAIAQIDAEKTFGEQSLTALAIKASKFKELLAQSGNALHAESQRTLETETIVHELAGRIVVLERSLCGILESANWKMTRPFRQFVKVMKTFKNRRGAEPLGKPRIAVIVTCQNQGRDLSRCVDGLARQLGPWDEIVLSDYGSTDLLTLQMLDWYEEAGLLVCRSPESLLSRIKAPIVLWLSPEQTVEPVYLQKALDVFQSNPEIGFVTCGLTRKNSVCVPSSADRSAILTCANLPFPMARRILLQQFSVTASEGTRGGSEMTVRLLDSGVQGFAFAEPLVQEHPAVDYAGAANGDRQHTCTMNAAAYERRREVLDACWRDFVLEYQSRRRSTSTDFEKPVDLSEKTPMLMSASETADSET